MAKIAFFNIVKANSYVQPAGKTKSLWSSLITQTRKRAQKLLTYFTCHQRRSLLRKIMNKAIKKIAIRFLLIIITALFLPRPQACLKSSSYATNFTLFI